MRVPSDVSKVDEFVYSSSKEEEEEEKKESNVNPVK